MTDELQIWALDGAGEATQVLQTNRTGSELALEEALVKNPEMLMPDLELVGRQTPTASGYLDLLGVDGEGRLVVFELKRGALTRDAVTQVIDYCSWLESMSDSDLAEHIEGRSGNLGIAEIKDLSKWYDQRFRQPVESLRPVRMALVGLGADEHATRMVDYLWEQGVSIALMTFYGYRYGDQTLLARYGQAEPDVTEDSGARPNRRARHEERQRATAERIAMLGIQDFWEEVVATFEPKRYTSVHPRTDGLTFYRRFIRLPDHDWGFNATLSVRFTPNGEIRITFFPASVHLCLTEFQGALSIPFQQEPPSNAPTTNDVMEQWYCELDRSGWELHKDELLALANAVYTAWSEAILQNRGEE